MSDNEDMNVISSVIKQTNPRTKIYSLNKIEGINDKGLFELAEIISHEIRFHIEKYKALDRLGRISFIGFSFGGLVLKAALDHLKEFKNRFYSFIALASPYLGWTYSQSKLFSMGIWAFSKISASPIIKELRMNDSQDIKSTALYKLSETSGLEYFTNVLMVGSYQDGYSSLESSLMQTSWRMKTDKNYEVIQEMCVNFNTKLKHVDVYKISINFDITEQSFDQLIGRTAHMQYLENSDLIKTLIYRYENLF